MSRSAALPEPLLSFDVVPEAIADSLGRLTTRADAYRQALAAGRISPNTIESVRIELTYHSNAIEGNTLSLRDTQLVIEGRTPAGGKPLREIYEARNHDRALRMVEAWAGERPAGTPLATADLLAIHRQVMADIDPVGAGSMRTERVLIAGTHFVPPGSHRFAELIPALLELAGGAGVHPALRAAELHYNVAAVHPFRDGNGRTARLSMNYLLLACGFPPAIIDVADRGEYLAGLDEANAGRWERFGAFIVRCVEQSIEKVLGIAGPEA